MKKLIINFVAWLAESLGYVLFSTEAVARMDYDTGVLLHNAIEESVKVTEQHVLAVMATAMTAQGMSLKEFLEAEYDRLFQEQTRLAEVSRQTHRDQDHQNFFRITEEMIYVATLLAKLH